MANLGVHYLIELHGCDVSVLNDLPLLREALVRSLKRAGATVIQEVFHAFSPHGVTGVVVIAESHSSIHTWPEHSYAAIDVFSCTEKLRTQLVIDAMAAILKAKRVEIRKVPRGECARANMLSEEQNEFH